MKQANGRKRTRKYTAGLKSAPMILENSYYKSDKHKRLKEVEALNVKVDGVKFKNYLDQLDDYRDKYHTLDDYVKACNESLQRLLIDYGYNTPNYELNALVVDIESLNIIHPDRVYTGFTIVDGYIVGLGFDLIVELKEPLPEDVYNGYWYYTDKLQIDTVKYQQIWGG